MFGSHTGDGTTAGQKPGSVNVMPGVVMGEIQRQNDLALQQAFLMIGKTTRLGKPDDLAAITAFPLSDEAEWIIGQVWYVGGGRTCGNRHFRRTGRMKWSRPAGGYRRSGMPTSEYRVIGMSCGHCEAAVRSEVAQIPGIDDVTVSAATGSLVVTSAQLINADTVLGAVDEAGYEAVLVA